MITFRGVRNYSRAFAGLTLGSITGGYLASLPHEAISPYGETSHISKECKRSSIRIQQ